MMRPAPQLPWGALSDLIWGVERCGVLWCRMCQGFRDVVEVVECGLWEGRGLELELGFTSG